MWSIDALVQEILRDKDYFEESRGGVTLSGGEPMMQAGYVEQLLPRLKEAGIHTNMETSGMFQWEQIEPLLPHLDLIYFDLKHMDGECHKRFTRQDNQVILSNFARLSEIFPSLQARMPIIPGMNDDLENVTATARFLTRHGHHTIHCLPYHNLGEAKIPRIDTPLSPLGLKSSSSDNLKRVKSTFEERRVHALIYD